MEPTAKRRKPFDAANTIIDMTPWYDLYQQQRQQTIEGTVSDGDLQTQVEEEQAQMAEEQKGCAILDSGATPMVSSVAAADTIQQQMVDNNEEGNITVSKSDKLFKFADGDHEAVTKKAEVQITNGLLKR